MSVEHAIIPAIQDMSPTLPPVPHLLRNNNTPSEIEVNLIHTSISRSLDDVARVDGEIARLESHVNVDQLRDKRNTLIQFQMDHKAILSCTRRLPAETLGGIFAWCRQLEDPSEFCRHTRRYLSQVCKYWRDVAFGTPKVWDLVYFDPKRDVQECDIEMVNIWLARSGQCPLYVHITLSGVAAIMLDLMQAIIQYSQRWQFLHINLPYPILFQFSAAQHAPLPLLQSLSLNSSYGEHEGPVALFADAPRLRDVYLCNDVYPSDFKIQWAQLKKYYVACSDIDECLEFLRAATDLVECSLNVAFPSDLSNPPFIEVPRLEVMSLRWTAEDYETGDLLGYLTLPALREFYYSYYGVDDVDPEWSTTGFDALLLRSQCPLQILDIECDISEDELIETLKLTPLLIALTLSTESTRDLGDQIFSRLTCHESDGGPPPCLSPKLKSLSFVYHDTMNENAIATMVHSRWASSTRHKAVNQLENLEVWVDRGNERFSFKNREAHTKLCQCRDEGLSITWMVGLRGDIL